MKTEKQIKEIEQWVRENLKVRRRMRDRPSEEMLHKILIMTLELKRLDEELIR